MTRTTDWLSFIEYADKFRRSLGLLKKAPKSPKKKRGRKS